MLRYSYVLGEQMNRISLSKTMAFVFFVFIFSPRGFSADIICSGGTVKDNQCVCRDGYIAEASQTSSPGGLGSVIYNCKPDSTGVTKQSDCKAALKKLQEGRNQFIGTCKQLEAMNGGSTSINGSYETIKKCGDQLSECGRGQTEDLGMSMASSMFGGLTGMGDLSGLSGEGTCSKYTQDKLDSLIQQAKRDEKTSNSDLEKMNKEIETATEKANEAKAKLTEEFTQQQDDNARAEQEAKEKSRNDQATISEKSMEAEKSIRTMQAEIEMMQDKQKLLIANRRLIVAEKANRILVFKDECTAQVMERYKGQNSAGSQGSGSNLMSRKQAAYKACMSGKMVSIKAEDAQFPVEMARLDKEIANRIQDLADAQKSFESFKKMASEAQADAAAANNKREEMFQKRQVATWQKMADLTNQLQQQSINQANSLSRAKRDVLQAGNELGKLQRQTAFGDKTPTQIENDVLGKYLTGVSEYESLSCENIDGMPKNVKIRSGVQ